MNSKIASDTANSAKTLAQQIAQQMAQEPLELLKDAKEQVTGREFENNSGGNKETATSQGTQTSEQLHQNDVARSTRLMEAFKRELDDIRKQKVFSTLQEKIMAGEVVPLEEYPELTMDQKQVLKAQMEAVKQRMLNEKYANAKFSGVPSINSKPSRRFGAGQKQAAQKEQTRVEKPVPPSG